MMMYLTMIMMMYLTMIMMMYRTSDDDYDDVPDDDYGDVPDDEGAGLFGPLPVMDGQPRTHRVRRLQLFQAEESLT